MAAWYVIHQRIREEGRQIKKYRLEQQAGNGLGNMTTAHKSKFRMLSRMRIPGKGAIPLQVFLGILLLILCILTVSCGNLVGPLKKKESSHSTQISDQHSILSLFLRLHDPTGPALTITITGIDFLRDDVWHPLAIEPLNLDASRINDEQVFILRQVVEAGRYTALRLHISQAGLNKGGRTVFLALKSPEIEQPFTHPLHLGKGGSQCLFMTWDTERSLPTTAVMQPVFQVAPQSAPLLADLAYVACPDINTVHTVRTDRHWVTGALGVTGGPLYLAVDEDRNRLYVLTGRDPAIKVFELSSNRQTDVFRLPLIRQPSFFVLSPDKQWAYVLDTKGKYLVKVDLESGSIVKRSRLGDRGEHLIFIEEFNRLAISSTHNQEIVFYDPEELKTIDRLSVGGMPQGMMYWQDSLFVAEASTNTVSAYDFINRSAQKRFHVGRNPQRLLGMGNRLYVTNQDSGTISINNPRQLGGGKTISVGGDPLEMLAVQRLRSLYVGNGSDGEVVVLDLTTDRITTKIDLQTEPKGFLVMP